MKYKTTWIFTALVLLACLIVTCQSTAAGNRREKKNKNIHPPADHHQEPPEEVGEDGQIDLSSRSGRSIAKALRYIFGGPPPAPDSRMLRRRYKPSGKAIKYKSKSFKLGDDGSIIRKKGKGGKSKSKSKKHKSKGGKGGKKGRKNKSKMVDTFSSFDDGTLGKSYSSYYRQQQQSDADEAIESAGFQGLAQLQGLQASVQQQDQGQQNQIIDAMDPIIHTLQHHQAVQALMRQQHQQLGGQPQQAQVMTQPQPQQEEKVVTEIIQHQYGPSFSQGGYPMTNMNLFAAAPQSQPQPQPQQQNFQNQMNPPPSHQQQQQQQQPMANNFHYSPDTGFVMFAAPPPTSSPPTPIVQLSTDNTVNLGGLNFAAVMDPNDLNGGTEFTNQKINPPNWSDPNLNLNEQPAVVPAAEPQQQQNFANMAETNENLGSFNSPGQIQMKPMDSSGNLFNEQQNPQLTMTSQNNVNLNFKNAGHLIVGSPSSYPTSAPPFTDAIPDTLDSLSFGQSQNGGLNFFPQQQQQQQQESTGPPFYTVASTTAPPSYYTTSAVMSQPSDDGDEVDGSSLDDFAQQQQPMHPSGPTPSPQLPSRPPIYSIRELGSATPSPPPLKNLMLNFSAFGETPGGGFGSSSDTFQFTTSSPLLRTPFFSTTSTPSPPIPIQMTDSIVRGTHLPPLVSSNFGNYGNQNQPKSSILPPTYSQMTVEQLQQLQREQEEDSSNELDSPFPPEGGADKESDEEENEETTPILDHSNADKKPFHDPSMTPMGGVKTESNFNYMTVQNGNYPINPNQQISPAPAPAPAAPAAAVASPSQSQQMRANAISQYLTQYTPLVQVRNDPVPPTPINSGSRSQPIQSQSQIVMPSRYQQPPQQEEQPQEQKIELIDLRGQSLGEGGDEQDFEIIDSSGQPLGPEEQLALHSHLFRLRGQTPAAPPALQQEQQSQLTFSRTPIQPAVPSGQSGQRLISNQRVALNGRNLAHLIQQQQQQHSQVAISKADNSLEEPQYTVQQSASFRGQMTTGQEEAQRRQYTFQNGRGQFLDQSQQQQQQQEQILTFPRNQQKQQQQKPISQFQSQQSHQSLPPVPRYQVTAAPKKKKQKPMKSVEQSQLIFSREYISQPQQPQVQRQPVFSRGQSTNQAIYSRAQQQQEQALTQQLASQTQQLFVTRDQPQSQTQNIFSRIQPPAPQQQQQQQQQQRSQLAYSNSLISAARQKQQQQQYNQQQPQQQKIVNTWSFKDSGSNEINSDYLRSPSYSQASSSSMTSMNLNNSPRFRANARKTDYSAESLRSVIGSLYPSAAPPSAAAAATASRTPIRPQYTPPTSSGQMPNSRISAASAGGQAAVNSNQNSYARSSSSSSSAIRMPLQAERTIIYNHYHNYASPPAIQNGGTSSYERGAPQNYHTSVSSSYAVPPAVQTTVASAARPQARPYKIPPYNPYIKYSPVSSSSSSSEILDSRQRFEDPSLLQQFNQGNFPSINFDQTNYLQDAEDESPPPPDTYNSLRRSYQSNVNYNNNRVNSHTSKNNYYGGGGGGSQNFNSMEMVQQQQQPQIRRRIQSTYSVPGGAMMTSRLNQQRSSYNPTHMNNNNNFNNGNMNNEEDAYKVHSVFTY